MPTFLLIIAVFYVFFPISIYGQSKVFLDLEKKWQEGKDPEIALQIAREIVDEQADKALYYVKEAQKNAGASLQADILLLLTEIYSRKYRDKEARSFYEKVNQLYVQRKDTLNPKYLFVKAFWLGLHNQSTEAVSLLGKYLQSIDPSTIKNPDVAALYLEYAVNLMRAYNYSKSLEVLQVAEAIFKRLDMQKHLGKLYNLRGLIYKNTNYLMLGIENYIKAIKIYKSYNPISRNLAVTYANLGNIYITRPKDTSFYKEAEKFFMSGVQLCEQIKDTVQTIHFYERIGFLALLQKNSQKAKTYFEKGFKLAEIIGSVHLQNYNQLRLADAYFKGGKEVEAIQSVKEILPKIKQNNDFELLSYAYFYLIDFYQTLNKHQEALVYVEEGIKLFTKRKINSEKGMFYQSKIISLMALGRWSEAQKANDTLSKIFVNNKNWHLKIYQFQKKIDSASGNYQSALAWADKYQVLKDSIDNAEKSQNFSEVQQRLLAEEKEEENCFLRFQNEQEKAYNKRSRYLIITLAVLSVLLLAFLVNWWFEQQKLKATNQKIVSQKQQIKEYADQLAAKNEMLKKKNEFDSKLFAIVSHDLRGPVHSVATLLNMMKNEEFEPKEMNNLLELAHNSLFGVGQLLDNLLFWAKSYQSNFKPTIKEIKVKQVADKVLELLTLQAKQKGILLENKIVEQVVCLAEEEALHLTIRNLVANAIKFTKTGGKIVLDAICANNHCKILIQDTGVGISPENIGKIFEKSFYTKGTSEEKGSGLGLMLCKEFIERNKGTIEVSSQVGVGSTFTITLPIAEALSLTDNNRKLANS